ncbi:hypothetical protein AALB39_04170 [Lachnospiraceae bacterium 54-53]
MEELKQPRRLVIQKEPTDGFLRLYMMKRLDLTAEKFVTDEEFRCLFTEDEVQISENRLKDYDYIFNDEF